MQRKTSVAKIIIIITIIIYNRHRVSFSNNLPMTTTTAKRKITTRQNDPTKATAQLLGTRRGAGVCTLNTAAAARVGHSVSPDAPLRLRHNRTAGIGNYPNQLSLPVNGGQAGPGVLAEFSARTCVTRRVNQTSVTFTQTVGCRQARLAVDRLSLRCRRHVRCSARERKACCSLRRPSSLATV